MSKSLSIKLALFAFTALVAISACSADTVVVKPSNMQGWVLATVSSAYASFNEPAPLDNELAPGALYVGCGGAGSSNDGSEGYPGQIWMGTNAYTGKLLSEITELKYSTWTSNSGIYKPTGTAWYDRWSGPRQPIGLRLVVDPQIPGENVRMLYYRPRGNEFAPYVDDDGLVNMWVNHDCMLQGYWVDINLGSSYWNGSWSALLSRYPNGKIVQPTLQPGNGQWPEAIPPNTPNACSLSLQWGGEMYGLNNVPSVPAKNWWRESCNGIAWADNVRIGANGETTVYDFESDNPGNVVFTNTKFVHDLVSYRTRNMHNYVVAGKVTEPLTSYKKPGEFWVSDGSPTPVRVFPGTPSIVSPGYQLKVFGLNVPGYSNRWYDTDPVLPRIHTTFWNIDPPPIQ